MTQQVNVNTGAETPQKPKGLAIAGLVTGIIGCIPCLSILALISAIVAIILSAIALKKVKAGTGGGKGMAMAGLICGIAGIVLMIVLLVVWGAALLNFRQMMKEGGGSIGGADNAMLFLRCLPYC